MVLIDSVHTLLDPGNISHTILAEGHGHPSRVGLELHRQQGVKDESSGDHLGVSTRDQPEREQEVVFFFFEAPAATAVPDALVPHRRGRGAAHGEGPHQAHGGLQLGQTEGIR